LPLYSPDVAAVAVGAALDFAFAVRNISAQAKDILSPARSHLPAKLPSPNGSVQPAKSVLGGFYLDF